MTGKGNMAKRAGVLAVTGSVLLLLAACSTSGSTAEQTGESNNTFVPGKPYSPNYIAAVHIDGSTDIEAIAAELGGTPVPHNRSGELSAASARPASPIAFIGLDSVPALSTMSSAGLPDVAIEPNQDRFFTSAALETATNSRVWADTNSRVWADTNSRVWADTNSRVWADTNSRVWADGNSTWERGQFVWMPENTETWNQIELREGHSEAERLGNNVIIAVIDSGVDTTHPALVGALSENGYDFVDNDDDPSEVGHPDDPAYGHGTIVAGIVRQIAPRATILPIRALEADGSGDVLNVVRAVYYAIEQGADVVNLSLGGPDHSAALEEAIRYADSVGVFVTATAGNFFGDGGGKEAVNFPARLATDGLDFVISVASVNRDDYKSDFSNYGNTVEIAAPGEYIYGPYPDFGSAAWSGTSMSAPVIAGAIALALGERELEVRPNRIAREMFNESAGIYFGSNNQYRNGQMLGAGRIDIEDFLGEVVD